MWLHFKKGVIQPHLLKPLKVTIGRDVVVECTYEQLHETGAIHMLRAAQPRMVTYSLDESAHDVVWDMSPELYFETIPHRDVRAHLLKSVALRKITVVEGKLICASAYHQALLNAWTLSAEMSVRLIASIQRVQKAQTLLDDIVRFAV